MRVVVRHEELSRFPSLAGSLFIHGMVLAWVAWGPPPGEIEQPKSLYQQVIAPNEKRLVWYHFSENPPEVRPADLQPLRRLPRYETKIGGRAIVSSSPQPTAAKQMVWQPVPRLQLREDILSPNLLAVQNPKLDGPKLKPFLPPTPKSPVAPAVVLPEAPEIAVANASSKFSLGNRLGAALAIKPKLREFAAPVRGSVSSGPAPALAAVPQITLAPKLTAGLSVGDSVTAALASKPPPKGFVGPPTAPKQGVSVPLAEAPALNASHVDVAIVGLQPVDRLEVPIPPGSRTAQFAAGPTNGGNGGPGEPPETARIVVPGLSIRNEAGGGGDQPARPKLLARALATSPRVLMTQPPIPTSVSSAPDPRFEGRRVYTLAVQMPNVSSSWGSWIMWFAERQLNPGENGPLRLPVPLRKVDPKYYPSAIAGHIEGKVQLSGVIRTDGRVDLLTLLKSLDESLDRSAAEALLKWEFEPATRNAIPVEMDVVVEVPFYVTRRLEH